MLTARADDKDNGCIINTAMQVASNPTRISVAVQKTNLTGEMIQRTSKFNVSVLTENVPFETIGHFGMQSGKDVDKFADFAAVQRSQNGLLYLTESANAMFSCNVTEQLDLGSHMLFIGEVTQSKALGNAESCTYVHYHNAIKPQPEKTGKKQLVCSVCGYVYDGDDMPEDYICPLCKHGKEAFREVI